MAPAEAGPTAWKEARPQSLAGIDLVAFLRRRWPVLLIVPLLVGGGGSARILTEPPVYTAEATLFARLGREFVYRPEVGTAGPSRGYSVAEMVNSEAELLTTRDLAEHVVREVGVKALYPLLLEEQAGDPALAFERAVVRFRDSINVQPVLDSSVIKVSYEHGRPDLAARAVNLLVDRFVDKHLEVHSEERSSFLEDQLEAHAARLKRAEDALLAFKRENDGGDLLERHKLLLGRRSTLDAEFDSTRFRIAELELAVGPPDGQDLPAFEVERLLEQKPVFLARLEVLGKALAESPVDPRADAVVEAQRKLIELRLQEGELLRNFRDGSRSVRAVRQEIESVQRLHEDWSSRSGAAEREHRGALQAEVDRLSREIVSLHRLEALRELLALRTRRSEIEARRIEIEKELADLSERVRALDARGVAQRRLERDVTLAEASVQTYLSQVEEARITEELDREKRINVKVIDRAVPPIEPSGLSTAVKLTLSGFVGILAGAALAVFLEVARPS